MLAPLSKLSGASKAKFKWTPECQKAFEEAKQMMSKEAMLACPDFDKEFHVHADASDHHAGAQSLVYYTLGLASTPENAFWTCPTYSIQC